MRGDGDCPATAGTSSRFVVGQYRKTCSASLAEYMLRHVATKNAWPCRDSLGLVLAHKYEPARVFPDGAAFPGGEGEGGAGAPGCRARAGFRRRGVSPGRTRGFGFPREAEGERGRSGSPGGQAFAARGRRLGVPPAKARRGVSSGRSFRARRSPRRRGGWPTQEPPPLLRAAGAGEGRTAWGLACVARWLFRRSGQTWGWR